MPMIAEKNKSVDLQPVTKHAKRPSKPALDDLGDALRGKHEQHLVFTPIRYEVNIVCKMHSNRRHEKLLSQKVRFSSRPMDKECFSKIDKNPKKGKSQMILV
jgi:hypothetical protein